MRSNSVSRTTVDIGELKAPKSKLRGRSRPRAETLRRLLKTYGPIGGIVVAEDNEVIDGFQRVEAALSNGATEVPITRIHGPMSEDEKRLLRIQLNRVQQDAHWNRSELREAIIELQAKDIDVSQSGFSTKELARLVQVDNPKIILTDDQGMPSDVRTKAVTCTGQIWQLGSNRLGCGQGIDGPFTARVTDGKFAKLALFGPLERGGRSSADKQAAFWTATLNSAIANLSPIASMCLYSSWRQIFSFNALAEAQGFSLYAMDVWAETPPGRRGRRSSYELVSFYGPTCSQGREARGNPMRRHRSSLLDYSSTEVDLDKSKTSPALEKPISMICEILKELTAQGDALLDPFANSGNALIAAHRTGRICFATEQNPLLVDAAIRRWQIATGDQATRVGDGKTFNALAEDAR